MAKLKITVKDVNALAAAYPALVKEVTEKKADRKALYKVVNSLKHIATAKGETFSIPGVEIVDNAKNSKQVDLEDLVDKKVSEEAKAPTPATAPAKPAVTGNALKAAAQSKPPVGFANRPKVAVGSKK